MSQNQIDRAVARRTGESLSTIRSYGFSIVEPPEMEPLTVDWDALAQERVAMFPSFQRPSALAA